MNKNNSCNNCGKPGHQFHQCKLPITSYGTIVFRTTETETEKQIQYLMIRRKDSFGYIDFLRGKYSQTNKDHLLSMFNEMSILEKQIILTTDFDILWKKLWCIDDTHNVGSQYKYEEISSKKKFDALKEGITINNELISLQFLVDNSTTNWPETEWEFPKGRRNYHEKELECALREFEEETGISKHEIKIIENMLPVEETFLGSNHKPYKHKYFLGYTEYKDNNLQNFQHAEVSKIEWKSLDECLVSIRPYHLEKKKLITNINTMLEEYSIF